MVDLRFETLSSLVEWTGNEVQVIRVIFYYSETSIYTLYIRSVAITRTHTVILYAKWILHLTCFVHTAQVHTKFSGSPNPTSCALTWNANSIINNNNNTLCAFDAPIMTKAILWPNQTVSKCSELGQYALLLSLTDTIIPASKCYERGCRRHVCDETQNQWSELCRRCWNTQEIVERNASEQWSVTFDGKDGPQWNGAKHILNFYFLSAAVFFGNYYRAGR